MGNLNAVGLFFIALGVILLVLSIAYPGVGGEVNFVVQAAALGVVAGGVYTLLKKRK